MGTTNQHLGDLAGSGRNGEVQELLLLLRRCSSCESVLARPSTSSSSLLTFVDSLNIGGAIEGVKSQSIPRGGLHAVDSIEGDLPA